MKTNYTYNPETLESTYIITEGQHHFIGKANCAPEDYDFANENTGLFIAQSRAEIKYYKFKIEQYKQQLIALKEFAYSCKQSGKIKNKHILNKQILRLEHNIFDLKFELRSTTKFLNAIILEKSKLYTKIRERRQSENRED